MSTQNDKQFFGTALLVLGALVAFTATIIIIASLASRGDGELRPEQVARIENRIKAPVTVITDPDMLLATSGGDEAAAREPLEASVINERYCTVCHATGVLAAPVTGQAADWSARLAAHGLEGLIEHSINGFGAMPARGGNADLSDEEMRATVEYLLSQSGL